MSCVSKYNLVPCQCLNVWNVIFLSRARFKYTSQLAKGVPEAFDKAHFTLSCDPMRVMSMPESLNAITGMSCSYLGDSKQFRKLSVSEILRKAGGAKASFSGLNWTSAESLEFRPVGSQFDSNHVGE
jgi:hypothetical protein